MQRYFLFRLVRSFPRYTISRLADRRHICLISLKCFFCDPSDFSFQLFFTQIARESLFMWINAWANTSLFLIYGSHFDFIKISSNMDSMGDSLFLALITLGNKRHLQEKRNSRSQVSFKNNYCEKQNPCIRVIIWCYSRNWSMWLYFQSLSDYSRIPDIVYDLQFKNTSVVWHSTEVG